MVVIYLPGQHGLQRGHPDAAGSEKNHNGEGHPASRRERQQDVAQRVGRHAGDNGLLLAETFGGGTSDEGLSEGVQDSEYRKRQADHRRAPAKAVLAENDPERCRHLSYELHDKEDSHKCGDDSHAPRPPEGADWVEGSQGHRSTLQTRSRQKVSRRSMKASFVVIHFRNLEGIDFPWLLAMLQGSFISHINTLVVPGGKMGLAMELIMLPLVQRLMEGKKIE